MKLLKKFRRLLKLHSSIKYNPMKSWLPQYKDISSCCRWVVCWSIYLTELIFCYKLNKLMPRITSTIQLANFSFLGSNSDSPEVIFIKPNKSKYLEYITILFLKFDTHIFLPSVANKSNQEFLWWVLASIILSLLLYCATQKLMKILLGEEA